MLLVHQRAVADARQELCPSQIAQYEYLSSARDPAWDEKVERRSVVTARRPKK
jgi:hypothetical protein